MKKLMTTAAVLVALATPAAALVIRNDVGGNLGARRDKITLLKKSGEEVQTRWRVLVILHLDIDPATRTGLRY